MAADFDAVVVGSGFGGSVVACRLAEAGYRVLVLERGRRWRPEDYPRRPDDAWIFDASSPEKRNGWIDLRVFPNMTIVLGAGVGGGSLIYANVSIEAKPELFAAGWPPEITYQELRPYYERVGQMLAIREIPANQWTERTRLMQDAAQATGYADRFRTLPLAVAFDENWHYGLPDPHNLQHSRRFLNAHGQQQGTCVHLGNCVIGCEARAKNTLDLNYIPTAERHGAEFRPLHLVTRLETAPEGYRVSYDRLEGGTRIPGSVTGRIVVLAAGSLGSTELLLRCRNQFRTLTAISSRVGENWSSNGNFLTPAFHAGRDARPTVGPTITAAIDFLGERSLDGRHHFIIEDGGFPDLARNFLTSKAAESPEGSRARAFVESLRFLLSQGDPLRTAMPWFGNARDAANGRLRLRRRWWWFGEHRLHLDWDVTASEPAFNALIEMHKRLARATAGAPFVPLTWTLARDLVTVHPLGGCNMATDPTRGVVDHRGEVFGCRNLYVADGSIIPEAIGANPSKTIAALAERLAKLMIEEGR